MLNLGLMKIRLVSASDLFFLLSADPSFIPVPAYRQALNPMWYRAGRHRTGFSDADLIMV